MEKTVIIIVLLLLSVSLFAKVVLPPVIGDNMVLQQQTPAAGGPYEITISDGDKTVLHDVMIGEVWFASGQSNMEMPMKGYGSQPAKDGTRFIVNAKASRPLRICNIERRSSETVQDSCSGSWGKNIPSVVAATSATAYFFADALQDALDVPVGIIVSSWGGSSIEAWIKREVLEKEYPDIDLGHLDGLHPIKSEFKDPCLLYNGQVAPLIPFTFKGIIWYQGETNRGRAEQYILLQRSYVKMMREDFHVPDAPFYCVQIAPFPYGNDRKTRSGYFCEAQQKSVEGLDHAGYVTTVDIGEHGTIHPCRKQEEGQRLAWIALQNDYGMDAIEAIAPKYKSVEFREGKGFVEMNVGNLGLAPMGTDIPGFEIAGPDHRFAPAKAMRDLKNKRVVVVWNDDVSEPVAVRYCWRNWCVGGLYNNFGIPAGPFRTDDWPINPADWEE